MARMPSLPRTMARVLLAAVFALALIAAPTHAQGSGIEVNIQPPDGGKQVSIVTTDVTGEITAKYRVATAGGGTQTIDVVNGVSLRQLLEKTGTDFGFETIAVPRADGSSLVITKDQIEDPRNQAVFYVDSVGVTHFIGPREPGASTVAAENYFPVSNGVIFTQESESKLKVSISPSKKKIELGGSVSFRATVTGNDDGDAIAYTWGISGKKQTQGSSSRFTQKFPSKDGVYKFLVAARIEGSAVSTTAVAKITVGDPEKAKDEQTGNGDATTGSDTGTGTGTGGSDSGGTYTPSYTPTPSAPVPPAPTPPPTPSAEPPDTPDIATSGTTVEGNLLADVSDPPPSNILESAARAAREGKQADDDSGPDGGGVSEAAISIAGVLALLALGAGIETREGRLPRWRAPHLRLPRRGA